MESLSKIDLDLALQVRAPTAPAGAAAEESLEDRVPAEDIPERLEDVLEGMELAPRVSLQALVAHLVVPLALLRIVQDVVRLGRLLETDLGLGIPGVPVRVVFQGHLVVGLADLFGSGAPLEAQDVVVVFLLLDHWKLR